MKNGEANLLKNKYEIVSKIKQGGFGVIYFGFDRLFDKPVAIKAIEPKLLDEKKYETLFLKEAKNAAKLSHNNIVHIYDLIKDDNGNFYLIMEFIDGYDLGRIIRQCEIKKINLPLELIIFIINEVCKALDYAHNKHDSITNIPLKLVHLDISPSNIMITVNGHVKLIDFGIAKIRAERTNQEQYLISGKIPYMAPEQINGEVIDRRTDICSWGTVFYELLTGTRLINTNEQYEAIQLIRKTKVDTSKLEEKQVPQPIQNVLLKMLNKKLDERYYGANGVYNDLSNFLLTRSYSMDLSDELSQYFKGLFAEEPSAMINTNISSSHDIERKKRDQAEVSKTKSAELKKIDKLSQFETNGISADSADQKTDNVTIIEGVEKKKSVAEKQITRTLAQQAQLEKAVSEIELDFSTKKSFEESSKNENYQSVFSSEKKQHAHKTVSKIPTTGNTSLHEESSDDLHTLIAVLTLSTKSYT